ncbi:MAG: MerR family transcriptional regulator [Chloroflexi bacterium AL-W]|nr:MerR family transcriptional regulator [Chloroflexi bacterium AL-N1]NOK70813.1 MerR family transcriptional regulator [Chloroflexi bacterium AL-N10]NOK78373.1 MerR family transcriptional regulator [Chloroflexi bacterium AL-N5]NOK85354.1 MerR family transcriptional regulator [Chloroflexi bacterium AL-W]NOK92630.1 MerR family transcriptional regulator [Chloroflexi bacterium AL-N15]
MIETMRIGKLAERVGVTPRTIRYYEQIDLFSRSERVGRGFRHYTEYELARLQKIDALKQLGLSLDEIRSVIDLYFEDATGIKGKQKVLTILQRHLDETQERIDALGQFRHELATNIARVQQLIEHAHAG